MLAQVQRLAAAQLKILDTAAADALAAAFLLQGAGGTGDGAADGGRAADERLQELLARPGAPAAACLGGGLPEATGGALTDSCLGSSDYGARGCWRRAFVSGYQRLQATRMDARLQQGKVTAT